MGRVVICGDMNSRLGHFEDFIEGVDDIPPRNILDYNSNGHGTLFGDFLIS